MEDSGDAHYDGIKTTVRKKRSLTCRRRPRPEGSNLLTPSHNFSNISSDNIPAFDNNPTRKEFSLSHCISRAESIAESERANNASRCREITNRTKPSNGNGSDLSEVGVEKKKMKLKISGVNRLAHANGSSTKSSKPVKDTTRSSSSLQKSLDDCDSPLNKKVDPEGVTWNADKEGSMTGKKKQGETGSATKSKRAPKKQVVDSDDDDNDDEIRYLEKLKYRTASGITNGENSSKRKTVCEQASEDMDCTEESKLVSDETEIGNEIKRESTMTSRQRALASASGRSSAIEFPDGLPPTTRRKKETLTAMEQQLKKAEAAQRRKVQVEKAARESEEEAIRKILGQDSGRKKREDKNKKRLDELAQEKAAQEEIAKKSSIRTIIGPEGTTVSFPIDKMPSLFDSKPVCYPPPREKCVVPTCTNPYKYRDSKTKLPLCSLKCYKAVQENNGLPPV